MFTPPAPRDAARSCHLLPRVVSDTAPGLEWAAMTARLAVNGKLLGRFAMGGAESRRIRGHPLPGLVNDRTWWRGRRTAPTPSGTEPSGGMEPSGGTEPS